MKEPFMKEHAQKAIIIGATSGIGRELAKQMSLAGYSVGITGRRSALLDTLESELPGPCFKSVMDLSNVLETTETLQLLFEKMDDVDIVVISSGTATMNPEYPLSDDLNTIAVNVTGFTTIANLTYRYFSEKGSGHIVGISSVAGIKGGRVTVYNASKAYMSTYLEGLSCRARSDGKNICITDIRPGFVDTNMAKGKGIFWSAPVQKAASQIFTAIKKKRRVSYVTKRWNLIALLLKSLPFTTYLKLSCKPSRRALNR